MSFRTSGRDAISLLLQFFERWPAPEDLLKSEVEEVGALMQPLGLHMRRANNIRRFTGKSLCLHTLLSKTNCQK